MMSERIITLAHGSGGQATHSLIKDVFLRHFDNVPLSRLSDGAVLDFSGKRLVYSTDSFVVQPIFFPGGDIGSLAVNGTVNDISVMGATPLYLSAGFIVEEGFGLDDLEKIVASMAKSARTSDVKIVTGDFKVVEHGACDKIFINTTGIGLLEEKNDISKRKIKTGDKIIINGTVGDHGAAVLASREELNIRTDILSDCSALNGLIADALKVSDKVKFMRDPTRGGLATTLNEIVNDKDFGIIIEEDRVPVKNGVRSFCEILGFDPLYLANEGKVIIVVDESDSEKVLRTIKSNSCGTGSSIIGSVVDEPRSKVCLRSEAGGLRVIDMLVGEQMPRIC